MPRPKRRANPGSVGNSYANRTDKTTQPITVPTGGQDGQATSLAEAQASQPLPQTPTPAPTMEQVTAEAQATPFPAGLSLGGPSTAPNEPITAGLPTGPGPGPEALRRPKPPITDMLERIALASDDPVLFEVANQARRRGL
jgi:hypothetical protein